MSNPVLTADSITAGYGGQPVTEGLSLQIMPGKVTVLCGPNGSGKSTLLAAMRGAQPVTAGQVLLDQAPIAGWTAKDLARKIASLGQTPSAPDEMRVTDLVALGRYSHRRAFRTLNTTDQTAIDGALHAVDMQDLTDRPIASLSGGQVQRAWLAMVIAQDAPTIFLDEPTNHLDLAHAMNMLRLIRALATEHGRTIVVVLHDLNMAAMVADRVVLLQDGAIRVDGLPKDVLTPENIRSVFNLDVQVFEMEDSRQLVISAVFPGDGQPGRRALP